MTNLSVSSDFVVASTVFYCIYSVYRMKNIANNATETETVPAQQVFISYKRLKVTESTALSSSRVREQMLCHSSFNLQLKVTYIARFKGKEPASPFQDSFHHAGPF